MVHGIVHAHVFLGVPQWQGLTRRFPEKKIFSSLPFPWGTANIPQDRYERFLNLPFKSHNFFYTFPLHVLREHDWCFGCGSRTHPFGSGQ